MRPSPTQRLAAWLALICAAVLIGLALRRGGGWTMVTSTGAKRAVGAGVAGLGIPDLIRVAMGHSLTDKETA